MIRSINSRTQIAKCHPHLSQAGLASNRSGLGTTGPSSA